MYSKNTRNLLCHFNMHYIIDEHAMPKSGGVTRCAIYFLVGQIKP